MLSHHAKSSADFNLFLGSSISQFTTQSNLGSNHLLNKEEMFEFMRWLIFDEMVLKWYVLIIYFYVCNVIFQGLMSITQQAFNNFNPCSLFSMVQQHIVYVLLRQKISSMLLVKIMSWSIWSFFNIKPSQKTQLYFLSLMFLRYI